MSPPELCSEHTDMETQVETENLSIHFFKRKHHSINLSIKHIYTLFFVCFPICNKRIITSDKRCVCVHAESSVVSDSL